MKSIGIVSGKGGVGKTSITASIACLFDEDGYKTLATDTDVDAPNLAILFQARNVTPDEKNGKERTIFKVKTTEKATFLPDLCTHCKKCINEQFCAFSALRWDEELKVPVVDPIACEGCRGCYLLCPQKAFEINAVESGTIQLLDSAYGFPVITGETILGAQTSGKLVTELKSYAKKILEQEGRELMIVDGPPGIGCPVIAALGELNYVAVVMEPTQAALHDAIRVIEVIKNFNIPYGVILNKADIWEEGRNIILKYLEENSIELLGEIKLDSEWPKVVAKGLPIVKVIPDGPSSKSLKKIYKKLEEIYLKME